MKKYIKPFLLVLFNNVFLLMLNTKEVTQYLWSIILFALLWFLTFSMLVVGMRYSKIPNDEKSTNWNLISKGDAKNMAMENEEVKYYQPKFAKWIQSRKWDSIAEELSDTYMDIITRVMNAEKDGDCSWIIWHQCDNVLDRIRKIAKKIK